MTPTSGSNSRESWPRCSTPRGGEWPAWRRPEPGSGGPVPVHRARWTLSPGPGRGLRPLAAGILDLVHGGTAWVPQRVMELPVILLIAAGLREKSQARPGRCVEALGASPDGRPTRDWQGAAKVMLMRSLIAVLPGLVAVETVGLHKFSRDEQAGARREANEREDGHCH